MKKDILAFAFLILIIILLISGIKIESVEEHYLNNIDNITEDSKIITFGIRCDTILSNYDKLDESLKSEKYVPTDGIILPLKDYVLREGDSVYDVLMRITKYYRIHVEIKGYGNSKYVQGINFIYEYSCGELSGWLFMVNGEIASTDSLSYKLKDKDIVEWVYSVDLGRDIV